MLAVVAARCEYNYNGFGKTGYLYKSVKDQLKWKHLSVEHHVGTIMRIGELMSLKDEDYDKQRIKGDEMTHDSIASALIKAYGDGK